MDKLEIRGNRLVVHLPLELDHHCTEELRNNIDRRLKEEPVQELEFDFTETVFMDSAGIGLIIGRYKIMQALGGRIVVSNMSRQTERVMKLSGIEKYIPLYKEESV